MAIALDSTTRAALEERLRFYRDLGLTEYYKRPVDPALQASLEAAAAAPALAAATVPPPQVAAHETAVSSAVPTGQMHPTESHTNIFGEEPAMAARRTFAIPPEVGAPVAPEEHAAALQVIREEIGDCTRCALHKGRNKLVFADGDPNARLMFVGEGPGADEDAQGLPFVGRAGQLLNNMIVAMGLTRAQVYIANVVKCRPPQNRTPEPDEANTCVPFLFRQIDVIRPQVLVALGATAATYLLGHRQPLAGLRGRVHAFRGTQLIVTYHPAFLLRDPRQKKEAWADLQIAMRELGLKVPGR
ncbi:MAG: uracil-DNA glycosylase [Terracidiphilus sp.]|nr:uracil-DNA glycosylase [Terracidiphilus sp.]